jgi:hypothetical protein
MASRSFSETEAQFKKPAGELRTLLAKVSGNQRTASKARFARQRVQRI